MAIIKGMKTADMGSITPYNEDIDKLASGVMAREGRAEETRNAIADARNQMLLKETRDNSEDMALAQKLEQGFTSDVDSMLDKADADYSMISKGDLQRLAGDYMGKTEWRALTNAKIQTDIYNDEMRKMQAAGKTPFVLGTDPNTQPLYNDDKSINHLTNTFDVQELYDHSQAAKDLFNDMGTDLKKTSGYTNLYPKGHILEGQLKPESEWHTYYNSWIAIDDSNKRQVDSVINDGLDGFLTDPEGKQYYDIFYQEQTNNGVSHEDADAYARKKVVALIRTYGISEYDTKTSVLNTLHQVPGTTVSTSPNKGKTGTVEQDPPITQIHAQKPASVAGINTGGKGVIEHLEQNTTEHVKAPDVINASKQDNLGDIQNNTLLTNVVGLVPKEGDDYTGVSGEGTLYIAAQNDGHDGNPTLTQIESHDKVNTKIDIINNQIHAIEIDPSFNNDSREKIKVLNNTKRKLQLEYSNKDSYKLNFGTGDGATFLETMSIKEISDAAQNKLISLGDIKQVLADNKDILENATIVDEQIFSEIIKDKDLTKTTLPTYNTITDQNGNLQININPILLKLKDQYESRLAKIYEDDPDNPDNLKLKSTSGVYEEKLLNAKIYRIDERIRKGKEFLTEQKPLIENIKNVFASNKTMNENLQALVDKVADVHLSEEEKEELADGNSPLVLDENKMVVSSHTDKIHLVESNAMHELEFDASLTGSYYDFKESFDKIETDYKNYAKNLKLIEEWEDKLVRQPQYRETAIENNAQTLRREQVKTFEHLYRKTILDKNNELINIGIKSKDEVKQHFQKVKDGYDVFQSKFINGLYTEEEIKKTKWYAKNKEYFKKSMSTKGKYSKWEDNRLSWKAGLNRELLEIEFEKRGLPSASENGNTIEMTSTLQQSLIGGDSWSELNSNDEWWAYQHSAGGKGGEWNEDLGTYGLTKVQKDAFYTAIQGGKRKVYGEGNWAKYYEGLDELTESFERSSQLYLLGEDNYSDNKMYYKKVTAAIAGSVMNEDVKLRRVIYNSSFDSNTKEPFNKQILENTITAAWNLAVKNNTQETELEFRDKWMQKALKGIRLETNGDNPFVAHFEYIDESHVRQAFEMSTIAVPRTEAMQYFGIEGMKMKYINDLNLGFKKTGNMYADIPTIGSTKVDIRMFQAQTSSWTANGSKIKKGEYYILSKDPKRGADPREGSLDYNYSTEKIYMIPFKTQDDVFTFIKDKSKIKIKNIESLMRDVASLKSSKHKNETISTMFGTQHKYTSAYKTKEEAIEDIEKHISRLITGESPPDPEQEGGNVNFQTPEN